MAQTEFETKYAYLKAKKNDAENIFGKALGNFIKKIIIAVIIYQFISFYLEYIGLEDMGFFIVFILVVYFIILGIFKLYPLYNNLQIAATELWKLSTINSRLFYRLENQNVNSNYVSSNISTNSTRPAPNNIIIPDSVKTTSNHVHPEFDNAISGNDDYSDDAIKTRDSNPINSGVFGDFNDFAIKNKGFGYNFSENPIQSNDLFDSNDDPIKNF